MPTSFKKPWRKRCQRVEILRWENISPLYMTLSQWACHSSKRDLYLQQIQGLSSLEDHAWGGGLIRRSHWRCTSTFHEVQSSSKVGGEWCPTLGGYQTFAEWDPSPTLGWVDGSMGEEGSKHLVDLWYMLARGMAALVVFRWVWSLPKNFYFLNSCLDSRW